jgi:S-DNA-T family DNA segregation ATPase FtsK/SpoIIIE
MAKANNTKELPVGPSLVHEIVAIAGLCLALFLLISLASYSSAPPVGGGPAAVCTNWGGWLGDFCARLLTWIFGLSAFGLVFFLFYFPFQLFFQKKHIERLPAILAGATFFLLSCSALLATLPVQQIPLFCGPYPLAGVIGSSLFITLSPLLGRPGFVVVALFVCLISLIVTIQFSPYRLLCTLVAWLLAAYQTWRRGRLLPPPTPILDRQEKELKRLPPVTPETGLI